MARAVSAGARGGEVDVAAALDDGRVGVQHPGRDGGVVGVQTGLERLGRGESGLVEVGPPLGRGEVDNDAPVELLLVAEAPQVGANGVALSAAPFRNGGVAADDVAAELGISDSGPRAQLGQAGRCAGDLLRIEHTVHFGRLCQVGGIKIPAADDERVVGSQPVDLLLEAGERQPLGARGSGAQQLEAGSGGGCHGTT